MENIVMPEELGHFVNGLEKMPLSAVGSSRWLNMHETIIKLSQQAILEAAEHREEAVKEMLVARDKLKVLVHEAYCVQFWKTRVLPHILDVNPNPHATFMIYTVFFHEGAVIALLDTALFHCTSCESLQDSAIDLIDYCAMNVAQIIGLIGLGYLDDEATDIEGATLSELERQKRDIIFKIGLRCISILNYIVENAKALPLSVVRRLMTTHDIPWLITDLLMFRPWEKRTKIGLQRFIDEKWVVVPEEKSARITKQEAQCWMCLRQLFMNPDAVQSYDFNDEKCAHLERCQAMLHDIIIDQLPPLMDLKKYLCQVILSGGSGKKPKDNLLLEEVPQISEKIIIDAERSGGFLAIAQEQEAIFLCDDKDRVFQMAQRLSNAYNTDLLAEMEEKITGNEEDLEQTEGATGTKHPVAKCANCAAEAEKKCGTCKLVFYCSRKCQLNDWPQHKKNCIKIKT